MPIPQQFRASSSRLSLVLALLLIAGATLIPIEGNYSTPFTCVFCGEGAASDAVLNVLLFVPLGLALRSVGVRVEVAVLLAFAATLSVESAQFFIPGRDASLGDILTNTVGGTLGRIGLPGSSEKRASLGWIGLLAVVAAVLVQGSAFTPSYPTSTYFSQWTPRWRNSERYGGRVHAVWIDSILASPGRLSRSGLVQEILSGDLSLRLTLTMGPRPNQLAPLFAVFDDSEREILMTGVSGQDLLFRTRLRALDWALRAPPLRWPDFFSGVARGRRAELRVRRSSPHTYCASLDTSTVCRRTPDVGRGWTLVFPGLIPHSPATAFLWIMLHGLAASLAARTRAQAAAGAVLLIGALALTGLFSGVAPPTWWLYLALIIGLTLGAGPAWHRRGRRSQLKCDI